MHSVFAKNFNLFQVKDSDTQIHTLHYYIAENIACLNTFVGSDSLQPTIQHKNLHRSRQISGLLGDVILGSDWLQTTLRRNRQQCIKIDHSSVVY